MYNFFVNEENRQDNKYIIRDSDCNHIKNVLRMKKGDEFFVSCNGESDLCFLGEIGEDFVTAEIIEKNCNNTELDTEIYLFQGLPKSDKMELIIRKAVELGVYEIIPVEMNRCVVKLDDKKKKSKLSRWQSISESAAKQSKRNTVPVVADVLSWNDTMKKCSELDVFLVPYESKNGMEDTKEALSHIKKGSSVGILIGPEGGFEEREIEEAVKNGGKVISLGKRILRTETAAITAVGMCMLYIEMTESEKK